MLVTLIKAKYLHGSIVCQKAKCLQRTTACQTRSVDGYQKKPDYLNLPFEVHFARMNTISYELMHKPGKPPKRIKDYKVIETREGRVFDVTFRCTDPSDGRLIYVMCGNLDEVIPNWLEMISDDDNLEIKWAKRSKFTIDKDGALSLVDSEDGDQDEYEDYESGEHSTFDYVAQDFSPDYLIVDADGSRIKIDLEGYELDANNKRLEKSKVVTYTEEQLEELDIAGREDYDILLDVGSWFK